MRLFTPPPHLSLSAPGPCHQVPRTPATGTHHRQVCHPQAHCSPGLPLPPEGPRPGSTLHRQTGTPWRHAPSSDRYALEACSIVRQVRPAGVLHCQTGNPAGMLHCQTGTPCRHVPLSDRYALEACSIVRQVRPGGMFHCQTGTPWRRAPSWSHYGSKNETSLLCNIQALHYHRNSHLQKPPHFTTH